MPAYWTIAGLGRRYEVALGKTLDEKRNLSGGNWLRPQPSDGLSRRRLTRRPAAAVAEHRHLPSARVLCQDDAKPLTRQIVQARAKRAARRAGLVAGTARGGGGGVHILRHSFCSHLAMRGAPARAIQELAGHKDLSMTQRYMRLSPAALDAAIRLLEPPAGPPQTLRGLQSFGDLGETAPRTERQINESGVKTGGEAGIRTLGRGLPPTTV